MSKQQKALIIKKHWLDLILSGEKTWEMRSRKTNIRGRIFLIESGSGLIKGGCELVGCKLTDYATIMHYIDKHKVPDADLLKKWNVAWIIENAYRLSEPIPYDHPKGAVVWVNVQG